MKKKRFEWGYFLLIPGIGYIVLLSLSSISAMVAQSFGYFNYTGISQFSLQYWQNVLSPQFFSDLLFSLKIATLTCFIGIIICYPLSMILEKALWQKTLLSLTRIPMFIPALVASFLIINVVDYHGIFNILLVHLNIIDEPLRLRNDDAGIGVLMIQLWKNVPFQMIIMYSAIDCIRKDFRDAAKNLGAGYLSILWHLIIPLSLPSALIAVVLVFIQVFNDFAIAKTAGPFFPTSISNLMYMHAFTFGEWNISACIGVLMILTSIVFVYCYTYISKYIEKS